MGLPAALIDTRHRSGAGLYRRIQGGL